MQGTLLIIDDEKNTREGLAQFFSETFDVYTASQPTEAFNLMASEKFDVIITDLRMGQQNGISIIDKALELPYRPKCIMMTAYGSIETAVEAMKHGAYDFISKPIQLDKLESIVKRALLDKQVSFPSAARKDFSQLIGQTKTFLSVFEKLQKVAPTKTSVLITGETGTGKELFAHQLHNLSPRKAMPFVPVHCAALPENLIESELFGHERGAFTGALQRHIGLFESANRGTIFLDEIGEIDANTQVKLLRFLETKCIERLGGTQAIPLDVRLVCATHRNLQKEVLEGRFREDLFYRLNVVEIHLPPLRERSEDILPLLNHYLQFFAQENHLPCPILSEAVKSTLQHYIWPGNIRELRNFAESTVVMHNRDTLGLTDLDPKFLITHMPHDDNTSLNQSESSLIRETLRKVHGNKSEAARTLGIPRRTFYRKLDKFQI